MRYIHKKSKQPEPGNTKIKEWFAICPIRIGDETRWFERVAVEYEYKQDGGSNVVYVWVPIKFVEPTPRGEAAWDYYSHL